MATKVEESFRNWITEQEEHVRLENYREYENYYYNQVDALQLLSIKMKDSLAQELRQTANICGLVVDTKTEYICGKPLVIQVTGTDEGNMPDELMAQAERDLYYIYKRPSNSLLLENASKLVRLMSMKGDGFIKVFFDENIKEDRTRGILPKVQIRVLNPAYVFPKYKTTDYQELEWVAIKEITVEADGQLKASAQVYYDDIIQFWEVVQTDKNAETTSWVLREEVTNPYGFIPVIHFKNGATDLEYEISDLLNVTDIQDAINKTLTDLLVTADQQAFQRLALFGAVGAKGMELDTSPASVLEILDPEARLDVIQPADIAPLLNTLNELKDTALFIAQIPKAAVGQPEGGAVSGYSLRVQYIPLESKCAVIRESVQIRLGLLNSMIFEILRVHGYTDYTMLEAESLFQNGLPIDDSTVTDNVIKKHSAGLQSKRTSLEELGIEDVDEELDRIAGEQMEVAGGMNRIETEAQLMAQQLTGAAVTATPEARAVEEATMK